MTMDIRFNPADLARLERNLSPELVRGPIGHLIRDATLFAQREARAGVRDNGPVSRSIMAEVHGLEGVIRGNEAALAVEFGRHAGAPPPPPEALRAWARSRGLEDFIYSIAQAISRRGIKGRFFLRAAITKLRQQEFPRLANRTGDEIADAWRR